MKIGTPSVQGFLDNGKLPCGDDSSIGRTPFIDSMEYLSDFLAQAAYVTNDATNLQSYSESTIKSQGSYSLKGVAAITDSLNKTLTRTFS